MKVFLYGMQSSGASMVVYYLAQHDGAKAIFDNFNNYVLPYVSDDNEYVIAKYTVNPNISVVQHIESFKPDKSILVLRNPIYNYISLSKKPYKGDIDSKFEFLEDVFRGRDDFDLVLKYEDFVLNNRETTEIISSIGVPAKMEYYEFNRTRYDIREYSNENDSIAIYDRHGFGNIRCNYISQDFITYDYEDWVIDLVRDRVSRLCPSVVDFYA